MPTSAPKADLDVVGVGNAIVDVLANSDDAFLARHDVAKGGMTLIDEARAETIYADMAPGAEMSGGSAANTIACVASLGGRGGFIGKVADDQLGRIFVHDLRSLDVAFDNEPLRDGPATARCLINVTPDAQRSMATFLGAAGHVGPDDVDPDFLARASITYLEGYLFEQPVARDAFAKAAAAARAAGRRVSLTLSDGFVVDRNREALLEFIPQHVDILFANHLEAQMLFGVEADDSDSDALDAAARALCPLTAITMSEKGSRLISREGESVAIAANPPEKLVDTTGAGDAYAAGVLFGLAHGKSLANSGALGALAASEVISHFGARPQTSLRTLAEAAGLI